jgi:CrcB protein
MTKILLIAAGGAAGALGRYGLAGWAQRLHGGTFPVGTLAVNVLGCLLIGWLVTALSGPLLLREELRAALLVGFLGGFTTFSTFGYETMSMASSGQRGAALLNIGAEVGLGLLAVWIGMRLAALWPGV